MPRETQRGDPGRADGMNDEDDEPLPPASEEDVLEETVRMAREGRRERDADPKEPKPAAE